MVKKLKKITGEVGRELMKERLAKHLDYVESLIRKWMQELSVPAPFVIGEPFWPCQSTYIPGTESNEDKNHVVCRHLRSRTLWRNHFDWERGIREIERLGLVLCNRLKAMHSNSSQLYFQTALWAAFEKATGGKLKRAYEQCEGKGIAFYGHIIVEESLPETKAGVEEEHWEMIMNLARCGEMVDLIKRWEETKILQKRMVILVNKALLSSDIFYPCKFCKRLMKA